MTLTTPNATWVCLQQGDEDTFAADEAAKQARYELASAITDATKIADPLLIIHGMADDNVVFENATELIAALQEANVPLEMMLYPGYTHRVSGENISPHRYDTVFRFLEHHGVTPPE